MKTRILIQTKEVLFTMLIFIIFILVGCSKDNNTADDNPNQDTDVNNYIVELPSWDIFCPTKSDSDEESDPVVEFDCDNKLIETTTPCSITRTPEEIVTYDPASSILYLGSLIQGIGYMEGLGSIQALPIYQRAPITMVIDVQMPNNNRVIENPTLSSVEAARAELVVAAQNTQTASSISFKTESSHSVEQLAISLGLSAKFMLGSVKTELGWTHEEEKNTVSAYFIQSMYTVSMEIPQRPGDLFSDDFTQELLDEQISLGRIGPNNLPVYVSNIVYGRMMLFTMTSTHQADSMGMALDARYKFINGSIDASYQNIIDNSTFTLTTLGGDAQSALDFISSGQYGDFFNENPSLTTAVPLSYTLLNLGNNKVAKVSETAEYNKKEYDQISVQFYASEEEWRDVAQYDGMTLHEWDFNNQTLWLANEAGVFTNESGGQVFMGTIATYSQDSTDFPFDFYLKNHAVPPTAGGSEYALVYNDQEGFDYQISVGDIDNWEDDDFEIGVAGSDVYAIGLYVFDNTPVSEEFLEVFAVDGMGECFIDQINEPINGFMGIISPIPLKRIWFNEDTGGDDIGIDNFTFGVK